MIRRSMDDRPLAVGGNEGQELVHLDGLEPPWTAAAARAR